MAKNLEPLSVPAAGKKESHGGCLVNGPSVFTLWNLMVGEEDESKAFQGLQGIFYLLMPLGNRCFTKKLFSLSNSFRDLFFLTSR